MHDQSGHGSIERFLLDQVQAAVIATDAGGHITHWNRHAETLFGYPGGEALGRDLLELIVDPLDEDAVRGILECLGAGEAWQGEVHALAKDGGTVLTRARASVTHDEAGRRLGLAVVIVDATDFRRSELRLAAQYAETRVLSEEETLADATPRRPAAVGENLGWEVGAIWEVDRAAELMRCAATWHAPDSSAKEFDALTRQTAFPKGAGLPGLVWETARPAWIEDIVREERKFPRAPVAGREGLHGAIGFPILLGRE